MQWWVLGFLLCMRSVRLNFTAKIWIEVCMFAILTGEREIPGGIHTRGELCVVCLHGLIAILTDLKPNCKLNS